MPEQPSDTELEEVPTAALTTEKVRAMLNRADIILTRGGGLTSYVIRWLTQSYWNHVAIVFVVSDKPSGPRQGFHNTFILEAESRGIDAHPIDKYIDDKKQDMAIYRFPDSALPPERATEFLRRVRGFAFDQIDARYGYGTILTIGERILGPVGWVLRPLIRALKVATGNRKKAINDFVCSGVVQYAYYRATFGAETAAGGSWDPFFETGDNRRNLIVDADTRAAFDPQATFQSVAEQLKLTTPADFAAAAAHGVLECVAERTTGEWSRQLTKV
jgi:hypothetical protein